MHKKKIIVLAALVALLLAVVFGASELKSSSGDAVASGAPAGYELVKSHFVVPPDMSASASRGQVITPESIHGISILRFPWARSSGTPKGICVSVDSGNIAEAGPYCFTSHQVRVCNALVSVKRPATGDFATFGFVRPQVTSVTVRTSAEKKQVPASGGSFFALTESQAESCEQ